MGDGVGKVKIGVFFGERLVGTEPVEDFLGVVIGIFDDEFEVLFVFADAGASAELEVVGAEDELGVALTEGGETVDVLDEGDGELGEGEGVIDGELLV